MEISNKEIEGICRAFWRRIEPYKNDHEKELPDKMPVEFMASMGAALNVLNKTNRESK